MTKEKELELLKKYPKILQDYGKPPMQSCMAFGLECGDGWYDLLDNCMGKIQHLCDLASNKEKEVKVVANQIKEKYGELRFYVSVCGADEIVNKIIYDIIDSAESDSLRTCEVTGEQGTLCQVGGWYRTLCYKEARKDNYIACNKVTEEYWKQKDDEHSTVCAKTSS
jgi:hypothetical protein